MAEKLFSIHCETCGSRLAVRDAHLIGHILSCPKCSSMVMVQAPEGWTPPDADAPADAADGSAADDSAAAGSSTVEKSAASVAPAAAGLPPTTANEAATLRDRWSDVANVPAPPVENSETAAAASDVPLRGEDWMTPRQKWMRRYLPKIGAAVAGVVATVGLWYAFSPSDESVDDSHASADAADHADDGPPDDALPPHDIVPIAASMAPRAPEPDDPLDAAATELTNRDVPISLPVAPVAPPVDPGDNPAGQESDAVADAGPERPRRDPLPVIDVAARLNDPILKLEYLRTPLVDYLRVLSTMSTIPITLDIDALAEAGVRPETPISVRRTKMTMGEALDLALAKVRLRYVVVDQHIIVTTVESDASAPPVRRELSDLVGVEEGGAERLAKAIERLIEPLSWQTQRTTTSLRVDGTGLVVVQSPRTMRRIDALLATLRTARRDPLGVAVSPPPALQTRRAAARDALSKKITLNYTAPTRLDKILARLEESSKLTILVDWQALAGEDVGPATLARMSATDVTVEGAFEALVEPLFLAFRAIDEKTIEITTQDGLAGNPEMAVHPLADLAADAAVYAAIVEKLRGQFGPSDSAEVETTADSGVAWYVDEPSKTLLLLAPQDSQVELEAYLRELRAGQRQ